MNESRNDIVEISVDGWNKIVSVENNHETPNYRKTTIKVGERMPKGLLSLLRMNPQRFNVVRV